MGAWRATVHRVTKNQSDTTEHMSMKENKVHHDNHKKGLSCQFPGAQRASFIVSILNPLGMCWWSTAAAVHDSIPAEADGKCPWQVPICHWHNTINPNLPIHLNPLSPFWYPYVCCLHLCLYFCFANRFIFTIFIDSTYILWYIIFVFLFFQGIGPPLLWSFNGPEPGGPESMLRKWKRERS